MNIGYNLTIINDENVPMAASIENNYTVIIVGITLFTILAFLLFLYLGRCRKYRMRLFMLQCELPMEDHGKLKFSWNLWKLRAKIQEMESKAARQMVPYKM